MTGPRLSDQEMERLWNEYQATKKPDPYKPTGGAIAAESTTARGPVQAPAARRPAAYAGGLLRQGAQGLSFNTADEIEGGIRSLLPGSGPYKQERDKVRAENDAFAGENPKMSLLANLAGGAATGMGALRAAKAAPALASLLPSGTAGLGTKMLTGAAGGAVAGGAAGAGAAPEMSDVFGGVAKGAAIGGAVGGAVPVAGSLLSGARNLAARVGQGQAPAGRIRSLLRADSPEQSAEKRVLSLLRQQNETVDDVAARSATADAPDVLGEVIGQRGIRTLSSANRLGYQAPDQIGDGLTRRARDEVDRVRSAFRAEAGDPVDDVAFAAAKLLEAQTKAAPIYDAAIDGVTITDPRVASLLERPAGAAGYDNVVRNAANRGQSLPGRSQVLSASRPAGGDLADVPIAGAAPRGPSQEAVGAMTTQEMQGARRGITNYAKMTDEELQLEQVYLAQHQAKDAQAAAIRETPAYMEYLELKSQGLDEDARGIMEQMGYHDPEEFKALAFSSAGAKKNAGDRAARIAEVDAEVARRQSQVGAVPSDATPPSADRSMPSRDALTVPEQGASIPTLDAKTIQAWKFELDDQIAKLEGLEGGRVSQQRAGLIQTRDEIEGLLYEYANQSGDDFNLWGKAQATYAKPMQEREAFALGQREGRSMQPVDAARLGQGQNAEFTRKGVANTIQEDLARLQDGAAGQVRNPAPLVMGSDQVDGRVAFALNNDAEKIGRVQSTAANASRRLKNRQEIVGGSQTAQRLADDAGQGLNPSDVLQAASGPMAAAMRMAGKGADALKRGVVGQDMDATARLLMAGGPGEMSRTQALQVLRLALPRLEQKQLRSLLTSSTAAGSAGGRVR